MKKSIEDLDRPCSNSIKFDDMSNEPTNSAAWRQFLLAKRAMLAAYDRAQSHARTRPVATHHGNVAEAAVRDWLGAFLPKRFGVTSGYIRSQGIPNVYQSSHLDVIVYDQLEAPVLWIEENRDKAEAGRARIIPAEYVHAIIEVKAAFNRRSVADATEKLRQLEPLMAGSDAAAERYPKYLPVSAVIAMLFFELRREDRLDLMALNEFREISFNRPFYGAIILRGDGVPPDETGEIRQAVSDQALEPLFADAGLLHGTSMAGTVEVDGQLLTAMLMWSDVTFSRFAFDLFAIMKGTYQRGRVSSFHGLDFGAMAIKSKGG